MSLTRRKEDLPVACDENRIASVTMMDSDGCFSPLRRFGVEMLEPGIDSRYCHIRLMRSRLWGKQKDPLSWHDAKYDYIKIT